MKLASYSDGSRDGQLVVVSRDLASAHFATGTATRLQQVLDDWNFLSPQLQDLYVTLNQGKARHAFAFDPRRCMAPLPRAFLRVAAAAAAGPGLSLCGDALLGPCAEAGFGPAAAGIDFQAGLVVVTGDVALGASPEQALDGVRLLMLANGWALRDLEADEQARGGGLLHSRPATAFGPVAVTPDELGDAWRQGRVHLALRSQWNGREVGRAEAGAAMPCHFGQLIADLARTRPVRAGSLVGSGPLAQAEAAQGFQCIAEQRAREVLAHGEARTPWLAPGDRVRIEMAGRDGQSVFGAIDQRVAGAAPDEAENAASAAPGAMS